jgi:chorismate mutase
MQLNRKKLAFLAAWTMSAVGTVYPKSATDHLQRLVEMSARRLAIAEQIALAKWDSGTPVEDASREARVIASAIRAGDCRIGGNLRHPCQRVMSRRHREGGGQVCVDT